MTPAEILARLRAAGGDGWNDEGAFFAQGPDDVLDELEAEILANRADLLAELEREAEPRARRRATRPARPLRLVDDRARWPALERALGSLSPGTRADLERRARDAFSRVWREPERARLGPLADECVRGRVFVLLELEHAAIVNAALEAAPASPEPARRPGRRAAPVA